MSKLLLVIDVQKDFINDNTKETKNKIEKLINSKEYDNIVFTKFLNNENSVYYIKLNSRFFLTEEGSDIAFDTKQYKVLCKTKYSALNSELIEYISTYNINEIYLCGFDTDACVYKTALDLFENNYNVYVLKDYTMSHKGLKLHNIFIKNLKRLIGRDNVI